MAGADYAPTPSPPRGAPPSVWSRLSPAACPTQRASFPRGRALRSNLKAKTGSGVEARSPERARSTPRVAFNSGGAPRHDASSRASPVRPLFSRSSSSDAASPPPPLVATRPTSKKSAPHKKTPASPPPPTEPQADVEEPNEEEGGGASPSEWEGTRGASPDALVMFVRRTVSHDSGLLPASRPQATLGRTSRIPGIFGPAKTLGAGERYRRRQSISFLADITEPRRAELFFAPALREATPRPKSQERGPPAPAVREAMSRRASLTSRGSLATTVTLQGDDSGTSEMRARPVRALVRGAKVYDPRL